MINRYLYVLALVLFISTISIIIPTQFPAVQASESTQTPEIIINDLVFTAQEFQDLNASGLVIFPDGMTIDSDYEQGKYTSQPIQAPNKFNAVVPQWVIDQSENSEIHLELRTGKAPSDLGEWSDIHTAIDWMLPEDEDVVGEMLAVPAKVNPLRSPTHPAFHEQVKREGRRGVGIAEIEIEAIEGAARPELESDLTPLVVDLPGIQRHYRWRCQAVPGDCGPDLQLRL